MRMWAQSHLCQKQQRATSVLAAAGAGIAIWVAIKVGAESEPRHGEKPVDDRKEPTLTR